MQAPTNIPRKVLNTIKAFRTPYLEADLYGGAIGYRIDFIPSGPITAAMQRHTYYYADGRKPEPNKWIKSRPDNTADRLRSEGYKLVTTKK